jgi:serine/threonine protein kinase
MSSAPTYDEAKNKFLEILNGKKGRGATTKLTVETILQNLKTSTPTKEQGYFKDLIYTLPTIKFDKIELPSSPEKRFSISSENDPELQNVVSSLPEDQGSYGQIFKGAKGKVYKFIKPKPNTDTEYWARQIFQEAWIQTVLGLDKEVGINIAQISGLFRSVKTVPSNPYTFEVYISMEIIPYSWVGALAFACEWQADGALIKLETIIELFKELGDVLTTLDRVYGFSHRDFHCGNLMFDDRLSLRIIDFGASCMKFNGVHYSMPSRPVITNADLLPYLGREKECFGLDIFMLFISILFDTRKTSYRLLSPEVCAFMYTCIASKNGRPSLTDVVLHLAKKEEPFHFAYEWRFAMIPNISRAITNMIAVLPADLATVSANHERFLLDNAAILEKIYARADVDPTFNAMRRARRTLELDKIPKKEEGLAVGMLASAAEAHSAGSNARANAAAAAEAEEFRQAALGRTNSLRHETTEEELDRLAGSHPEYIPPNRRALLTPRRKHLRRETSAEERNRLAGSDPSRLAVMGGRRQTRRRK